MAEKIPTKLFELIEQRDSGFILEGTRGTPNEQQLRSSEVTWIPNSGFMGVIEDVDGIKTTVFKEIRYIKNCDTIDKIEQEKRNIKPNPKNDLIEFKKGNLLATKNGSTIQLYNYVDNVFYNAEAPNRPDSATAIFRAIDLNKNAEVLAEDDEDLERALSLVNSLKTKTGIKDQPYKYNEERIEGLCTILGVAGDTVQQKCYSISILAKNQPNLFLKKVENFEQHILTEVNHAVQLNVIVFDSNTAVFKAEGKVIKDLGQGKMSHDNKLAKLSDFLKTQEGNGALTEIRLLTALAKDQALR